MPPNSDMDIAMRKSLPVAASMWVEAAKKHAKTSRIKSSFSIGQVQNDGGGTFHIDITNSAPEAGAYEFGSGEHSTKGEKKRYPILPRKAGGVLRIPRSRWKNYQPPPDVDPVYLRGVMHPGVEAVPFMKPALEEKKDEMAKVIGQAFKVEVIYKSIKEIFHSDNP